MRFLVPWRSDGGHRERLWAFCRAWWRERFPDALIVEGSSPDGKFNRAAAINDAARGDWDVAIVLDADVLADPGQVRDAVELARSTGRLTLAYERFAGLTMGMTTRVLDGYEGRWGAGTRFRSTTHESSIVVVPRALWETVGGFDERFVGWGQEDVAFVQACRVLGGEPERVAGPVYHLWHERSPDRRAFDPQYRANQALGARYRETREPDAMRELLAERFNDIYRTNEWNGAGGTRSGPGSSLEATVLLREHLPAIIADLGVASVLDAGCGDALWMPELPGYVGCDIASEAIAAARSRHPDRSYVVADICTDELPRVEAVICRDALQHLSLLDGLTALQNFRRTGAKWLLANTHRGGTNNDVASGGFYEIDLEAAPFWLGEPVRSFPDGAWKRQNRYPHKAFGVWEIA
jgi:hypothetical protein